MSETRPPEARRPPAADEHLRCTVTAVPGGLQNRLLSEMLRLRLLATGIEPILHRRIPPNDGGLAVGQAAIAAAILMARG